MKKHQTILSVFLLALLIGDAYRVWCHSFDTQLDQTDSTGTPSQAMSPPPPVMRSKPTRLDGKIILLQERLKLNPENPQAHHQLAGAYLQKAREAEAPVYYTKAESLLWKAMELEPNSVEAMGLMGALCLARHQFRDALAWGKRARALAPSNSYVYGVITDAHVELGEYEQAIESLQHMMDIRPDLCSYSRVSYLRELTGNAEGAIEAMSMAVNAGQVGTEARAWCRVQLGNLHFNRGRADLAGVEYQKVLTELPTYVHALAGQARIEAARQNYPKAISLYTQIVEVIPTSEYVIALGDVYKASGQTAKADRHYARVRAIGDAYRANGMDVDMEIALFEADHDRNLLEALRCARQAFEARPSIYAADVLAWTLYKTGKYAEAYEMSRHALRLGTKDAMLFFHTGMICKQLGRWGEARDFLEQALAINPHFSLQYAEEAVHTLKDLHHLPPTAAVRLKQ
jgi:tetratricopeptide (TPR) repeat protein